MAQYSDFVTIAALAGCGLAVLYQTAQREQLARERANVRRKVRQTKDQFNIREFPTATLKDVVSAGQASSNDLELMRTRVGPYQSTIYEYRLKETGQVVLGYGPTRVVSGARQS